MISENIKSQSEDFVIVHRRDKTAERRGVKC